MIPPENGEKILQSQEDSPESRQFICQERNPSFPSPLAGRYLQRHGCGGERYPCDDLLAPWSEPVVQIVQYTNALEPQRGQCSIHAFRKRSRRPKPGRRAGPCIGKPSFQRQTEGTSCVFERPGCEHTHLLVDGDKPVPLLDLRHDGFHRQHLELTFVEGKIKTP